MNSLINKIHHIRFEEGTKLIPDNSIDLIIADPPYFRIKGEFDFNISREDWEKLHEDLARESKRVLKDNGSVFLWGHAKNIAYQQVVFDKYFNLENSLVWEKTVCQTKRQSFDLSRSFAPVTERLLFYSKEIGMTGLEFIEKEFIAPRNPFAKQLNAAIKKANIKIKEVAEIGKFYGNVNNGGAVTNWRKGYNVPKKDQWEKLCEFLPIQRREYEELRREYEELRREYEELRRPFNNYLKLTDVLKYSQETHISKNYNHPTIKPEKLTSHLITICSKPGDKVLIPFAGSGTECAVSLREGRKFIGFEIDKNYVEMANKRVFKEAQTPKLFQIL